MSTRSVATSGLHSRFVEHYNALILTTVCGERLLPQSLFRLFEIVKSCEGSPAGLLYKSYGNPMLRLGVRRQDRYATLSAAVSKPKTLNFIDFLPEKQIWHTIE